VRTNEAVIDWFFDLVLYWCRALRTRFELNDFFVRDTNDDTYLSLKPLKQYVQDWWDAMQSRAGDDWIQVLSDLATYCSAYEIDNERVDSGHRIVFSLVHEWINDWLRVLNYAMADGHDFLRRNLPDHTQQMRDYGSSVHDVVLDRFQSTGKCPCTTERIMESYGLQVQLYISQMKTIEQDQDHSQCTSAKCSFNNIDPATYIPKHVDQGGVDCTCSIYEPPLDRIVEILARPNDLPLLTFEVDEAMKIVNVSTVSSASNPSFVAISYVSSHGLSNPNSNALPSCQLSKLIFLTLAVEDSMYTQNAALDKDGKPIKLGLWIDTLSR
jgi:hypothetical protein